jgi:hypothetical protein
LSKAPADKPNTTGGDTFKTILIAILGAAALGEGVLLFLRRRVK